MLQVKDLYKSYQVGRQLILSFGELPFPLNRENSSPSWGLPDPEKPPY